MQAERTSDEKRDIRKSARNMSVGLTVPRTFCLLRTEYEVLFLLISYEIDSRDTCVRGYFIVEGDRLFIQVRIVSHICLTPRTHTPIRRVKRETDTQCTVTVTSQPIDILKPHKRPGAQNQLLRAQNHSYTIHCHPRVQSRNKNFRQFLVPP